MCNKNNSIPEILDDLATMQFKYNGELLPVVYEILEIPVENVATRTVNNAAQRFLDFYLSNTPSADDVRNLDFEEYYDQLIRYAFGISASLAVIDHAEIDKLNLNFAEIMNKIYDMYAVAMARLEAAVNEVTDDDDCDGCDCCCGCDCDDDCDLEDDEDDFVDCTSCSEECGTCKGCCQNGDENEDEESDDEAPNAASEFFSDIVDQMIRQAREKEAAAKAAQASKEPPKQDNTPKGISEDEAARRLFEAIFGINIQELHKVYPKGRK